MAALEITDMRRGLFGMELPLDFEDGIHISASGSARAPGMYDFILHTPKLLLQGPPLFLKPFLSRTKDSSNYRGVLKREQPLHCGACYDNIFRGTKGAGN